jgi:hypothetical protein
MQCKEILHRQIVPIFKQKFVKNYVKDTDRSIDPVVVIKTVLLSTFKNSKAFNFLSEIFQKNYQNKTLRNQEVFHGELMKSSVHVHNKIGHIGINDDETIWSVAIVLTLCPLSTI